MISTEEEKMYRDLTQIYLTVRDEAMKRTGSEKLATEAACAVLQMHSATKAAKLLGVFREKIIAEHEANERFKQFFNAIGLKAREQAQAEGQGSGEEKRLAGKTAKIEGRQTENERGDSEAVAEENGTAKE